MHYNLGVYVLHFQHSIFDTFPYRHALHYIGYSSNIERRLEQHWNNPQIGLLRAVKAQGGTFTLARVFIDASVNFEYLLKRHGHTSRYCPICTPASYNGHTYVQLLEHDYNSVGCPF